MPFNNNTVGAAADILRFDLGSGWSGDMEVLLTTSYGPTTMLGVALTRDPNDELFRNLTPFLSLASPEADTEAFFNANVTDWVFYSWGTNIANGGTTDVTASLDPLQFNPDSHYYAFVAGGAALFGDTVNVDLEVSSVPVPAAVWLFGSGIVGLMGMGRRKRA